VLTAALLKFAAIRVSKISLRHRLSPFGLLFLMALFTLNQSDLVRSTPIFRPPDGPVLASLWRRRRSFRYRLGRQFGSGFSVVEPLVQGRGHFFRQPGYFSSAGSHRVH
jgi:hypothetical protein